MRQHSSVMATVLAITMAFCGTASAASYDDPDWPCVQRKVLNLSVGQMWAGPLIEETAFKDWRRDQAVKKLAAVLAVRRTSDEEADALIKDFAAEQGTDKANKLALLFAGIFTLIERERSEIIEGIGRYARTQTALTKTIDADQNELTALKAAAEPNFDLIEELEDKVLWESRIFKDRQLSLTYVCETPVILEKRAFAMARKIMGLLD